MSLREKQQNVPLKRFSKKKKNVLDWFIASSKLFWTNKLFSKGWANSLFILYETPAVQKVKYLRFFFLPQSFFFFLLALFTVFLREKLKVEELLTAEKSSLSGKHPTLYNLQTVTWKNNHINDDHFPITINNGKDILPYRVCMYLQNS
jgi:hypothetical protein